MNAFNGKSWTSDTIRTPGGDDYWDGAVEYLSMVYPNEDVVQHDPEDVSCVCIPLVKVTIGCHGEEGCLCVKTEIIHHSLDGRELSE